MAEFHLYRLFSPTGELLWIGATRQITARLRSHAYRFGSELDPTRTQILQLATYEELCAAEREALRTEQPKYNVNGVTRPYNRPWIPRPRPRVVGHPAAVSTIQLLTIPDVARRLSFTPGMVRHLIRTRRLPLAVSGRSGARVNWAVVQRHLDLGGELTPHWWSEVS